jgi:hypothetical protein
MFLHEWGFTAGCAINCIVRCNVKPKKELALALIPMRVKNETTIGDEIMGQDKMQA